MSKPENEHTPKSSPSQAEHPQSENTSEPRSSEAGADSGQVFDPESLELMCRQDLPGALRLLANHLERQEISGSLWSFHGNGMVQDWRREHFLMTLDLAVLPLGAGK